MNHVTFRPIANLDIGRIWDYSALHWDADQADRYTDSIRDTCYGLANGDKRGRHANIDGGYLKYPVGSHFIFFKLFDDGIDVIRILHHSMDFERHL